MSNALTAFLNHCCRFVKCCWIFGNAINSLTVGLWNGSGFIVHSMTCFRSLEITMKTKRFAINLLIRRFILIVCIYTCHLLFTQSWGSLPIRNSCHNSPFLGNSKLQANSNIVMPKLKISAAFENWLFNSSGAMYRESPSIAFRRFCYNQICTCYIFFIYFILNCSGDLTLFISTTKPKSPNLQTLSWSTKMFSNFMSKCMRSLSCSAFKA